MSISCAMSPAMEMTCPLLRSTTGTYVFADTGWTIESLHAIEYADRINPCLCSSVFPGF